MAISNDGGAAGGAFPRLRAEMSLCTGLADTRPSAEASRSAMANGLRPTTPRGRRGFVFGGVLASCRSLLGRRRDMYRERRKKIVERNGEDCERTTVKISKRWE